MKKKALKKKSPARASAPVASKTLAPKLAKGERLVGVTLHNDRLAHLVLLPGELEGTYAEALKWAKGKGGELPTRIDQLVLLDKAKSEFKPKWHWSCESYASVSDYAWIQSFSTGDQTSSWKDLRYMARAVRREPIQ